MPVLTIQLEENTLHALSEIARENGLAAADVLVQQQIERLVSSYRGNGLTPGIEQHIRASIQENRRLLQRLAQ